MSQKLLKEYLHLLLEKSVAKATIKNVPVPDYKTFSELLSGIIGSSLTISSDINEIVAAAAINKGAPVDLSDAASYAAGGSASKVLQARFQEVLNRALAKNYTAEDASLYIAGEIARGNAMGLAALADSGGGKAFWTADRGASLSEFVEGDVVPSDNPTDFIVERSDGTVIGYSAKSTASAAANFKNPGLKKIEDLAGFMGGKAGGNRAPEIQAIYDAGNKKMNRKVPGYSSMTSDQKKKYADTAKELGLYDTVLGNMRDALLAGVENTLASKTGKRVVNEFIRSIVPELPNPPYKVVFGKSLESAVIKPPSGTEKVAIHFSDPKAKISVVASGTSGITFVSSKAGKLFTFRIKFESVYGTNLKGALAD